MPPFVPDNEKEYDMKHYRALPGSTVHCRAVPCIAEQYRALPSGTVHCRALPCCTDLVMHGSARHFQIGEFLGSGMVRKEW